MTDRTKPHGVVDQTRAVALLAAVGDKIRVSSLSRYIDVHADALKPVRKGGKRLIDFEVLLAHRRANIRLPDGPAPAAASTAEVERSQAAARNIRAQRMLREHGLAKRIASLTPRDEVVDAAERSIATMTRAAEQAADEVAANMAKTFDVDVSLVRPPLLARGMRGVAAMRKALEDHGFTRGTTNVG